MIALGHLRRWPAPERRWGQRQAVAEVERLQLDGGSAPRCHRQRAITPWKVSAFANHWPLITFVRSASVTRAGVGKRFARGGRGRTRTARGASGSTMSEKTKLPDPWKIGRPWYISTPARWWIPLVRPTSAPASIGSPAELADILARWLGKLVVQGLVGVQRDHQQVGVLLSQPHRAHRRPPDPRDRSHRRSSAVSSGLGSNRWPSSDPAASGIIAGEARAERGLELLGQPQLFGGQAQRAGQPQAGETRPGGRRTAGW